MSTRYSLVLAICLLCLPAASFAQTVPTVNFFRPATLADVRISADGSLLALLSPTDSQDRIIIFKTLSNELVTQTGVADGQGVADFFWKGNDELIIAPASIAPGRERAVLTGELFAFHVPTETGRAIAGRSAGDLAFNTISHRLPTNPNGIQILRLEFSGRSLSDRPRAAVLELQAPDSKASMRTSEETRGPVSRGQLFADNSGTIRIAVATEPGQPSVVHLRQSADSEWQDISAQLPHEYAALPLTIEPVGFSADNTNFYYLAHNQLGTRALHQFGAGSSRKIFESEQFDLTAGDMVFARGSTEVIGVKLSGDYTEAAYFSEHGDVQLMQRLDASFPGERVDFVDSSADGTRFVFKVSSPRRLGDFLLYNTADATASLIGSANPELPSEQMATVNAFAIRNGDGLTLHGYVTLPTGTEQPLPLVVLVNDLPTGSRALPTFNHEAQFLAQSGFAVLQVNARGASGFGWPHEQAGNGQWATGIVADITLALRWAVQNEITTADKVCIMGTAYGAFAAITAVLTEPTRYQCAIAQSGIYDLDAINRDRAPFLPGLNGRELTETSMAMNNDQRDEYSLINRAGAISVPLFIAHGGADERTPFAQAEAFHNALAAASKPHEWLVKENEGHKFRATLNRVDYYNQVRSFLNTHLR